MESNPSTTAQGDGARRTSPTEKGVDGDTANAALSRAWCEACGSPDIMRVTSEVEGCRECKHVWRVEPKGDKPC